MSGIIRDYATEMWRPPLQICIMLTTPIFPFHYSRSRCQSVGVHRWGRICLGVRQSAVAHDNISWRVIHHPSSGHGPVLRPEPGGRLLKHHHGPGFLCVGVLRRDRHRHFSPRHLRCVRRCDGRIGHHTHQTARVQRNCPAQRVGFDDGQETQSTRESRGGGGDNFFGL